jgi:phosphatidylethanolamine/phosphatidyl-N-methylethanolamine N-methyltransferase
MRPEPDCEDYNARLTQSYRQLNYGRSLNGYVMRRGHALLEKPFTRDMHFTRVLEVGAGAGEHLSFVEHGFDDYLLTDWSDARLERAHAALGDDLRSKVRVAAEDAAKLSLPDGSVDRLIACHVLEHLYQPHQVLREWHRVLRPNGVLSILLPCDPGLMWRAGRMLGPRANASRIGIDYDYWMAREHVNPINNLVVFIRYYFDNVVQTWYPMRLPSSDLNLFYICHITRKA